ncbi:hypothetical protein H4R34_003256 [Dimargaris verticillata]|uniref:F-box domain-containing protein n=1 Tax=Dimargaris verticillata TaxID=2761393 RepID=A0A9W8B7W3_9FUNG|nr:hypothetical protein H4R34_003256 [Dimargaris verticillata]
MLPPDVIPTILSYCDQSTLAAVCRVNRNWSKHALAVLYAAPTITTIDQLDAFFFTGSQQALARCVQVFTLLRLAHRWQLNGHFVLGNIAQRCPGITTLNLEGCRITDNVLAELWTTASGCALTPEDLPRVIHGPQGLHLLNENGERYTELVCRLPRLRQLSLAYCSITAAGGHLLASIKTLRRLVAHTTNIDDQTVKAVLQGCLDLEYLDVSNCEQLTDQSIGLINTLGSNLRGVSFAGCYGILQASSHPAVVNGLDWEDVLSDDFSGSDMEDAAAGVFEISLS